MRCSLSTDQEAIIKAVVVNGMLEAQTRLLKISEEWNTFVKGISISFLSRFWPEDVQ